MGVIVRQSFKSSIAMYIGALVGLVNRLFLLPNYLTLEELGLIDTILVIGVVFSEFALLGIKDTLIKFFSIYSKERKLPSYLGLSLLVPLIGFAFFGLLLYLFQDNVISLFDNDKELITEYYYFIYPFAFFLIYRAIFTAFSLNKMRLTVPVIVNDVFFRVIIMALLLAKANDLINFKGYMWLYVGAYFIAVLFVYGYCRRILNMRINFNLRTLNKDNFPEMTKYGLFVMLMGLSNMVSQYTDSIMLASIKGLETSAIYSVAFFLGLSIEMPKRAISNISSAIIAKHWNENKPEEIQKLYSQSSINQGIIGVILFLLILFSLDEIFYILPKSEILVQGKNVAIIIGISRIIDMITGINNEIIRTSKRYRLDFYLILFFIGLSILTNYLLIPIYGIDGAAIATLVSTGLYNLVRYILIKRIFGFDPFNKKTLLLISILGFSVVLIWLIPDFNPQNIFQAISIIVVKSLFLLSLLVMVIYKLTLSTEINGLLNKLKNKIIGV